jgi:hypothetical protein
MDNTEEVAGFVVVRNVDLDAVLQPELMVKHAGCLENYCELAEREPEPEQCKQLNY